MTFAVAQSAIWSGPVSRAMSRWGISGHTTEAVYRRYDIVSPRDLQLAAVRMETYLDGLKKTTKEEGPETAEKPSGRPN